MGELWAAGRLANCPDVGRTRLQPVIDRDISAVVEHDTGEVEPDPIGVGGASGRDQEIAAFDGLIACQRPHLEADCVSGSALNTKNLNSKMHLYAVVAQHLQNCIRDVGIFPAGELWSDLHDADAAAEAAIGLRQLQADISAAKHDQVVGQSIKLERLDIGERLCRRETRNTRDRRVRPEIERHAIAGQHPGAAIGQLNLDGFRSDEAAHSHDQLGAAGLVAVEVHGDQAVDHLALSCQHSLHVDGRGSRRDPKLIGVVNEIGYLRAPNLILAGQTVGVRAGAADPLAFDDCGSAPGFGRMPSEIFATFATTEDEHFKVFWLGHFQLLVA